MLILNHYLGIHGMQIAMKRRSFVSEIETDLRHSYEVTICSCDVAVVVGHEIINAVTMK